MQKYFINHKSFIIYLIVGIFISGLNVLLLYLFIDIFRLSTIIGSIIVIGGTFILKFFIYKWTGFTQ